MPSIPAVMLVEGDPEFIYLMQRYALSSGCQIVRVDSVNQAVRRAQTDRPVLILMDPARNATECGQALQDLKADPLTSRIPVLICSANEVAMDGWKEDADGFLLMPVMYDDFLAVLATIAHVSSEAAAEHDSGKRGTVAPGGDQTTHS